MKIDLTLVASAHQRAHPLDFGDHFGHTFGMIGGRAPSGSAASSFQA